ncbi:MAG: HAD family hydrolase, partial [Alphaproteobacteria bacterium]|nr:HAD family hydrolase [Alphaproteobacteria bacterium]
MIKDPAPSSAVKSPQSLSGLSQAEADRRLQLEGPNALPSPEQRNILAIAKEVLEEPMLLLLLASGSLYLMFGDFKEGLLLFLFALLSVIITIVQETRTEHILDSLRTLSNPQASVIRDGQIIHIAATQLVRGDHLLLNEGERVSADGLVLEAHDLLIDESLLTGESVPVRKIPAAAISDHIPEPGGDDLPYVFAGSFIVRGSALIEVKATGLKSAIGKIGHSLQSLEREPPRLRQQTTRMVKIFAVIGVSVSLATLILYGLNRGDWLEASLAGIAIGMSMLPEELPVVLTVFMAMGAWRISKARVLTRRAAAIETLGSASVLCSDKTGTLTENKMRVAQVYLPDGTYYSAQHIATAPSTCHAVLEAAYLASARNPIDPMERAFHDAHHNIPLIQNDHSIEPDLIHAFGLRPDLLAVTHLWKMDHTGSLLVAAKGAPEAIAELCNLSSQDRENLHHSIDAMAAKGLRVLGVAKGRWQDAQLPASPHAIKFDYLGLIGLSDPIRDHVAEAIAQCQSAGIRVIMITGDYPKTALAIAH